MSWYTTVNTTYDGPPPLGYSPPDLITVTVYANVGGFFVSRTVTLQGDTTISSLIEAILKIQDNNTFPTSIARLGPPNAIGAPITSITPRVWKTTYSYKTIDVIVTDAPTSWTPPPTNAQSDSDRPTLFSFNYLNIHDPFCKIWTRLTRPADDYLVKLDQASPSLQYHKMQLTLNRTLRVPNDLCTHLMPASMGSLQIVSVTKFADKLPDCIRSKGGLLGTLPQLLRRGLS
ncbi:hypothetical protein FRC02_001960 [Tulasnella sp. 418]|nr:hypothetical protein FRC02_001960 [Tulasnella sp. 418]